MQKLVVVEWMDGWMMWIISKEDPALVARSVRLHYLVVSTQRDAWCPDESWDAA